MTDTDKWKKPFIRSLPIEYKLFWFYILDDCDHAGVWQVDMEVAEIRLGIKVNLKKAKEVFGDKIIEFDNGTKWFIPAFITFQYGAFNEANKMYKAIIPVLTKYNLMGHLSPIFGVKVQVQDKVMVKVQVKDREDFLTNQIWKEQFCMAKSISLTQLEKLQQTFLAKVDLVGKEVDSYKAYFVNWYEKNPIKNSDMESKRGNL